MTITDIGSFGKVGLATNVNVHKEFPNWGRGGGLVVSAHAYCSDDPSSNLAGHYLSLLCTKRRK
jgi:hypothetical protein